MGEISLIVTDERSLCTGYLFNIFLHDTSACSEVLLISYDRMPSIIYLWGDSIMTNVLLASGSIRRKQLLEQIGLFYDTARMDIDESVKQGEAPYEYVERLAREKAIAGLKAHPNCIILAADTTVELAGDILGKPNNTQDAQAMLLKLSGSQHQVLTGVAVAKYCQDEIEIKSQVVVTQVRFLELSLEDINCYVQTGEPMDKAGAYGIQGKAALFVEGIKGSFSNVVGLPLAETAKLLEQFGVAIWNNDTNTK